MVLYCPKGGDLRNDFIVHASAENSSKGKHFATVHLMTFYCIVPLIRYGQHRDKISSFSQQFLLFGIPPPSAGRYGRSAIKN